jgi:hypothetical protein
MPNFQHLRMGEFHDAQYFEFDSETGELKPPISFKFKATDDDQLRRRIAQRQQGVETDIASLRIFTTEKLPFKPQDKIYLTLFDFTLKIEQVRPMLNSYASLVNMNFPKAKYNRGVWLELGEL